tara:strand:+ start:9973 stop:10449 length:477 start_codon:yes stop_codon:yes gene_type:complete
MDDAKQDFAYRNSENREDIAQRMAEEYFTRKKIFWRILGSDPKDDDPIPRDMFLKMPPLIQKMPDMFAINSKFVFVEVKGCKEYLKLKLDDWVQYVQWNEIAKVMFFIYSASEQKSFLFYLEAFHGMLETATIGKYNDNGKVYFEIPIIKLEPFIIAQ